VLILRYFVAVSIVFLAVALIQKGHAVDPVEIAGTGWSIDSVR